MHLGFHWGRLKQSGCYFYTLLLETRCSPVILYPGYSEAFFTFSLWSLHSCGPFFWFTARIGSLWLKTVSFVYNIIPAESQKQRAGLSETGSLLTVEVLLSFFCCCCIKHNSLFHFHVGFMFVCVAGSTLCPASCCFSLRSTTQTHSSGCSIELNSTSNDFMYFYIKCS